MAARWWKKMTLSLEEITWPANDLAASFEVLALHTDFPRPEHPFPPKPVRGGTASARRWTESAARAIDLEIEHVSITCNDVDGFIRRGGPALAVLAREGDGHRSDRILVVIRGTGRRAVVLKRDATIHSIPYDELSRLVLGFVLPTDGFAEALLGTGTRLARNLHDVLHHERMHRVEAGWGMLLRLPATRSLRVQARHFGLTRPVVVSIVALILQYLLTMAAWFSLSSVALQGHVDRGRVTAWGIMLIGTTPVQLALAWSAGRIALIFGIVLKRRMLEGTFRLPIEKIRSGGVGPAVAVVQESTTLENSALTAISGLGTILNFITAWVVLSLSHVGWAQAAIYAGIWGYAFWLFRNFVGATHRANVLRGDLTGELVDRLVGHRTRLIQEAPERWHDGEDEILAEYVVAQRTADRFQTAIASLPRLWITLGSIPVFVLFIYSHSIGVSVVGLAGLLLGQLALQTFANVSPNLGVFAVAYSRLKPLLLGGYDDGSNIAEAYVDESAYDGLEPIVQAVDIQFEHKPGGRKIVHDLRFTIEDGDRILLEGPSGGGKSTLAALLSGLRSPTGGVLLARGFDQHTLSPTDWRRLVATAPQFHENHIFSSTLAFNLLAARPWPPWQHDLDEAKEVCRELGLGRLLDEMPAGIHQFVGMTGWQLSHGERSRVFIARALLQGAPLIILDESFGALDPETLGEVVDCVMRRAPALLVIAHR